MAAAPAIDPDLPRKVAMNLAASGEDLGLSVRVVSEGEPAMVAKAAASKDEVRDFRQSGAKLEGVARARAAQDQGLAFSGAYLQAGLMMAGEGNPTRRAQQVAQIKAASPAELQDVLAVNVRRNVELATRECDLRFAQYLRNDPAAAARIASPPEGKTVEVARQESRKWFGQRGYEWQRTSSMRDGQHTQLPDSDGRVLHAIRRGYKGIADELVSRGLVPAMSITGKSAQEREDKRAAKTAEANAVAAAPRRMSRGGMEL